MKSPEAEAKQPAMKSLRFILPLLLFAVLLLFLWLGLSLNPREVPSPLIGKPAPAFQLARLDDPARSMSEKDLLGQVWLLNVWASWCVSCMDEHPVLVQFSKAGLVPIYGLNYKDKPDAAAAWLGKHGGTWRFQRSDQLLADEGFAHRHLATRAARRAL